MRCDEVKEHIIDVIYDESGAPPVSGEIREHLRTCSACRTELEEMTQARKYLQRWEDEPPLRRFSLSAKTSSPDRPLSRRFTRYGSIARYAPIARYSAIAAMLLISILALANTRISWDKNGFSFSTHLLPGRAAEQDYYTKAELRNLLKQVMDDSESRTNETIYLMMQETLKTVEQDRWMDLSLLRSASLQDRNY